MAAAVMVPPIPRYDIGHAPQKIEVTTTDPVVGEALVASIESGLSAPAEDRGSGGRRSR